MKSSQKRLHIELRWASILLQHPHKSPHSRRRMSLSPIIDHYIGASVCTNSLRHQLHRVASQQRDLLNNPDVRLRRFLASIVGKYLQSNYMAYYIPLGAIVVIDTRQSRATHFGCSPRTMLPFVETIIRNLRKSDPSSFDKIVTHLPDSGL